jgi:alpha-amylase/alpha-mannosidase (GH57 family)
MPWVRLHGVKDYWELPVIARDFPRIRQTFNLVPSLTAQIEDYVAGSEDVVSTLSRRPVAELTPEEKRQILRRCFLCHAPRMIDPYPRFRELASKVPGEATTADELDRVAERFEERDWRDLQVWYNLVWTGERKRRDEPFRALFEKGHDFSDADKHALLDAQRLMLGEIIPMYAALQHDGLAELSTSPFYHPILPLLCDSAVARIARPGVRLPEHRFRHPEDAQVQIDRALAHHRKRFGALPRGMWPSEGSVSDEAIAMMAHAGIAWTASDEGVLDRTLEDERDPLAKYYPQRLGAGAKGTWVLFRDRALSDTIGFVYSSWNPYDAAGDMVSRMEAIRGQIVAAHGEQALERALVSVILDGENCWEFFEKNGEPFLCELFRRLSDSDAIVTVTPSAALAEQPHPEPLRWIAPGSWINSDFGIWIGHEEDNTAWDLLATARGAVLRSARRMQVTKKRIADALEEIYISEGSDWCWWFGDENVAPNQDDFDVLFRAHLARAYRLIDEQPPAALLRPIRRAFAKFIVHPPQSMITPIIDGLHTSEREWLGAGWFDATLVGGAMHRSDPVLRRIYFGRNKKAFYVRVDMHRPLPPTSHVTLRILHPTLVDVVLNAGGCAISQTGNGGLPALTLQYAMREVLEVGISIETLGIEPGKNVVQFHVELDDGMHHERWPVASDVECAV